MKYLLDTCTVSDFVKGQPNVLARIKAISPALIAVSALTRMEVEHPTLRQNMDQLVPAPPTGFSPSEVDDHPGAYPRKE